MNHVKKLRTVEVGRKIAKIGFLYIKKNSFLGSKSLNFDFRELKFGMWVDL